MNPFVIFALFGLSISVGIIVALAGRIGELSKRLAKEWRTTDSLRSQIEELKRRERRNLEAEAMRANNAPMGFPSHGFSNCAGMVLKAEEIRGTGSIQSAGVGR